MKIRRKPVGKVKFNRCGKMPLTFARIEKLTNKDAGYKRYSGAKTQKTKKLIRRQRERASES